MKNPRKAELLRAEGVRLGTVTAGTPIVHTLLRPGSGERHRLGAAAPVVGNADVGGERASVLWREGYSDDETGSGRNLRSTGMGFRVFDRPLTSQFDLGDV